MDVELKEIVWDAAEVRAEIKTAESQLRVLYHRLAQVDGLTIGEIECWRALYRLFD